MTLTKIQVDVWYPKLEDINNARLLLSSIIDDTPLVKSLTLSDKYQANIYLKREDLQQVRSYKIRGAYNKISSLSTKDISQSI